MSDSFLVPVIYGSVRSVRQGIKAARHMMTALRERGCTPVLVDPMEKQLPLLDKMYKDFEPGQAPAVMEELAELYRKADGFCVVSGEYNHGIPPALKNTLDHFLEEYYWRPAGIVCYSAMRWGGVRAAVQLRACLAEQGMVTIPTLLPFPQIADCFQDDGTPLQPWIAKATASFLDEFVWYMQALRKQREGGVPY